ncbi:MAG: PAS domain S-box protein [Caulobacteraceae bacterium]
MALSAWRIGWWRNDLKNFRLTVSETAKQLFGYPPDHPFTYEDWRHALHPDDEARREAALAHTLATGDDYNILCRVVRSEGTIRWLEVKGRLIRDENGEPHYLVSLCIDVTDRKRAEDALRESEERFRLIADAAPTPMWITRPGGSRRFVNQSYLEFLGVSFGEACNFDWRNILHPDHHDRVIAESVAGEATLHMFTLDAPYRRADGEWRWLHSVSQPRWGPDGSHEGFIGVAVDVTDAKNAEAQLEERVAAAVAEKLEAEASLRQSQRLEAVGQLTSGVAHDFNNLLTVILGNVQRLAKDTTDPETARRLDMIGQAAERGARLTSQLLAFSRRQKLEPAAVDLAQVIERMRDLMQSTLGGAIRVETELAPNLPHAFVDPTQIELVILNLAINARDAMAGGGVLTVRAEPVVRGAPAQPQDPAAGEYVALSVSDTGTGMPPEVREKAFEPFFTTKEVGKGSGLGLSQVLGLAQQSGGGVALDSVPGKGTTVTLFLPVCNAPPEAKARDEAPPRQTTSATVLLVDDDQTVRETTAACLESLGYDVVQAEGGASALKRLEEPRAFDVMLLDFAMPGMNGAEVARRVQENRPGLPIVILTGYADAEALAGFGEDEIIHKPFDEDTLARKLAAALTAPLTSR